MARRLKGKHFQVLPGNCDGYDPCGFGCYIDPDINTSTRTTAVFKRGTGARQTRPATSHVPDNILFIPTAPPAATRLAAGKLYREAHPQAKPEDMVKQVIVGFGPPATEDPFDVYVDVSTDDTSGNTILTVSIPGAGAKKRKK